MFILDSIVQLQNFINQIYNGKYYIPKKTVHIRHMVTISKNQPLAYSSLFWAIAIVAILTTVVLVWCVSKNKLKVRLENVFLAPPCF